MQGERRDRHICVVYPFLYWFTWNKSMMRTLCKGVCSLQLRHSSPSFSVTFIITFLFNKLHAFIHPFSSAFLQLIQFRVAGGAEARPKCRMVWRRHWYILKVLSGVFFQFQVGPWVKIGTADAVPYITLSYKPKCDKSRFIFEGSSVTTLNRESKNSMSFLPAGEGHSTPPLCV